MRKLFFCIIIACMIMSSHDSFAGIDTSKIREGDIIFQETKSEQAKAIKLATHSRYTHAGIIFRYHDRFMVLEAIQPVKITSLNVFINRGVDRHFVVKRVNTCDTAADGKSIARMKQIGNSYIGKNYDIYFEWSDRRIYCTELIWKIYKKALNIEVGKLGRLKDFDLKDPHVRQLMKKRFGNQIPYDEPVISPEAMFNADNLSTVMEN